MGLDMVVGILADADAEDEDVDMLRADFTVIRELLDLAGAGPWDEPELNEEDAEWFDMWGYSGLHTVRRLAVHLAENARLPEPLKGRNVTDDPLLRKAYTNPGGDPAGPFAHLIHHSDEAVTPAGEGWQRYGVESLVCLQLIHAAKHSLKTGAAIAFC
jgi:hypothetical protein